MAKSDAEYSEFHHYLEQYYTMDIIV
jgi:hypothetical protein